VLHERKLTISSGLPVCRFVTVSEQSLSGSAGFNTTRFVVRLHGVTRTYGRGKDPVKVLTRLNLEVPERSFEALMGPSGSGKSTLLNLIAGLDRPTEGSVEIAGNNLGAMSERQLARWRADTVGFVFQSFNLLPVLTARQNVELPLRLVRSLNAAERSRRALTALRIVGLEDRAEHLPSQLSGGQEQRVAIARAIVNDPQLIIADEPTGDLDRQSADDVLTLLQRLNSDLGKTIFMVTHDAAAAERATITRRLDKGVLVS
jgi:putative ABC transport system ATP-binding protein